MIESRNLFPWETPPIEEPAEPLTLEQTVAAMQLDFAYAVKTTAVAVHSNSPDFRMLVNSPRGVLLPRNEVRFSDGTTIEFQDIGLCQPNVPYMTLPELMSAVLSIAREKELEIA